MSSTGTLHETLLRLRQTVEADAASIAPATTTRKRKSTEILLSTGAQVNQDGAPEDEFLKMVKRYKEKAEECERDVDRRQEDFVSFKKKMDDLHSVYLYGLNKVATLVDLRSAPDALLPGNFPPEAETKSDA
jgi:hypothetical protein